MNGTPSPPEGYGIRRAAEADIPRLQAIERDAAELFRAAGAWAPLYEHVRSAGEHAGGITGGHAWVALDGADQSCGFALGSIVDGHLHLLELGVARAHQGRGLGAALLATVVDHARWRFDPVLTLTTDRDLPWNGPFYRRHGFVELDARRLTGELAEVLAVDLAGGLDPAHRIAMVKVL